MRSLHRNVTLYAQRVNEVANGKLLPYDGLMHDQVVMAKMVFAAFCIFWMVLWPIKFSMLLLYRGLLIGVSKRYSIVWWSIAGMCLFGGGVIRGLSGGRLSKC
jgi:hypothetical protein